MENDPHDWSPSGGPPGSIARFVHHNGITARAVQIESRPDRQNLTDEHDRKWNAEASHYRVTLKKGSKKMVVYWSQGSAVKGAPGPEDVLDSLAMDAQSYVNSGDFVSWAQEYGYDPDSRRAEAIHRSVEKMTGELKSLLGPKQFNLLLNETERL